MIETKREMVRIMLLLKEDLKGSINEDINNGIMEFINFIYNSEYTTFDKQIIEYIISNILNKSDINENEKNILILIIQKIKDKGNYLFSNFRPYKNTLIKIIEKVCRLHNGYNNNQPIKEKIKNIMQKILEINDNNIISRVSEYKNGQSTTFRINNHGFVATDFLENNSNSSLQVYSSVNSPINLSLSSPRNPL